jgi:hypothetical protein
MRARIVKPLYSSDADHRQQVMRNVDACLVSNELPKAKLYELSKEDRFMVMEQRIRESFANLNASRA